MSSYMLLLMNVNKALSAKYCYSWHLLNQLYNKDGLLFFLYRRVWIKVNLMKEILILASQIFIFYLEYSCR